MEKTTCSVRCCTSSVLDDTIYKFEPFSTDGCLMFLPAVYHGLNSKVIEIEGVIVRNRQRNETGLENGKVLLT